MKAVDWIMDMGARVLGIETERMRGQRLADNRKHEECVQMIKSVNSALENTVKKLTSREFNQWRGAHD